MKKIISIALCLLLVLALASCGDNRKETEDLGWEFSFESETKDVTGKTFIYEGEGLQGDDFTITFNEDSTFSYSEGAASSHAGFGTWSIEGNVITLTENDPEMQNSFEINDHQLTWLEKDSDNFIYVKLTDGAVFQVAE